MIYKEDSRMQYLDKIKAYLMKRGLKKNVNDLIIILICGLIIVILANFFSPSTKKPAGYIEVATNKEDVPTVSMNYEDRVKQELTDILGQIEGAGKVKVMIYFESGSESIPAYNENDSVKVTEETDGDGGKRLTNENNNSATVVTTNEGQGNKPFIVKEIKPRISGVIVIAEGAGNPDVKYKLYEAVKTVFNLQQYRVNIYSMGKK
jgi:stage III sporulation protein AG